MSENLKKFINLVVKNAVEPSDELNESIENEYGDFLKEVMRNTVTKMRINRLIESELNERMGDSAVKLNGDDVLVNGKVVGRIQYDLNDFDSGINFISEDGAFSKEFATLEDFYAFINMRFGVKESKESDEEKECKYDADKDKSLQNMKDKSEKLKKGKSKEDSEGKK